MGVFVQARERALFASEEVVDKAEGYVGCVGGSLHSLHGSWQRAYRLEDEAANSLLRAWAATVAAQEHVQLSVAQGLAQRIVGSIDISNAEASETSSCEGFALVAESAHRT